MSLDELLSMAVEAARIAGDHAKDHLGRTTTEFKTGDHIVTELDFNTTSRSSFPDTNNHGRSRRKNVSQLDCNFSCIRITTEIEQVNSVATGTCSSSTQSQLQVTQVPFNTTNCQRSRFTCDELLLKRGG
ncbi:MAG: hypothetical protein IID32_11325 [Planctomycetes bacterium]|nr:hypothetical protein [Planctomycetota bacterium]